jgi:hypothetical protein
MHSVCFLKSLYLWNVTDVFLISLPTLYFATYSTYNPFIFAYKHFELWTLLNSLICCLLSLSDRFSGVVVTSQIKEQTFKSITQTDWCDLVVWGVRSCARFSWSSLQLSKIKLPVWKEKSRWPLVEAAAPVMTSYTSSSANLDYRYR